MGVMKRVWLILSWAMATALVSFVTFQVLTAAHGEVSQRPRTPVVVAGSGGAEPTGTTTIADPATTGERPSTDQVTPTSSISLPASPSTPDEPSPAPTASSSTIQTTGTVATSTTTTLATGTSSTASPTTPTTATQPPTTTEVWKTKTVPSNGGSLTVRYRTGVVEYQAATPNPGFTLEVEDTSPEARVEFHNDGEGADYEIRVRWNGGALEVEVNEKG